MTWTEKQEKYYLDVSVWLEQNKAKDSEMAKILYIQVCGVKTPERALNLSIYKMTA